MYSIYAEKNGSRKTIYNDTWLKVGEYVSGTVVEDPVLTLEDNQAGTFKVTIPPDNQGYDFIGRYTTELIVCRIKKNRPTNDADKVAAITEEEIFRGRVIDEEVDFMGNRTLTADGELNYLKDTRQPCKRYSRSMKPEEYFKKLLAVHNSKVSKNRRFYIDTKGSYKGCQFDDWSLTAQEEAENSYDEDSQYRVTSYEETLSCINDALGDLDHPHIRVRWNNNHTKRYLDILKDYRDTNVEGNWGSELIEDQEVRLGSNLLDASKSYDLSDICSVIIPLGARLEGDEGHLGDPIEFNLIFGYTLSDIDGTVIEISDPTTGEIDTNFIMGILDREDIPGDQFFFSGRQVNGYGMYMFADANDNIISWAKSDDAAEGEVSRNTDIIEEVVDIPEDTAYVYVAGFTEAIPLRVNEYLSDAEAEQYVTVKDVYSNGDGTDDSITKEKGTVYVKDDRLLKLYGWVEKVIEFPNIAYPTQLYDRAVKYLRYDIYENLSYEVKAADLSDINSALTPYAIGKRIMVYDKLINEDAEEDTNGKKNVTPIGISFPISKLEIHLDAPQDSTVTLGYQTKLSISGVTSANSAKIGKTITDVTAQVSDNLKISYAQAADLMKNGMNGFVSVVRDPNDSEVIRAIVISDDKEYTKANNLWIWNKAGLAHYIPSDGKTAWQNFEAATGDGTNIAITMDGVINADFINAGHMLADHVRGGKLIIGSLSKGTAEIDSYLEVYGWVHTGGTNNNPIYSPGMLCRIDETGITYWGHNYNANKFHTIGITGDEIRGYKRNNIGAGSGSTRISTMNLVYNETDASLTANVGDLYLRANNDIKIQVWDGSQYVSVISIDKDGNLVITSTGGNLVLRSYRDISLQCRDPHQEGIVYEQQVYLDANGLHPTNGDSSDTNLTGAFRAKDVNGNDVNVHYKNGLIYLVN